MNELGKIIHEMRKKSKKTIKTITEELEISPQYLNDIENGKRVPSGILLKKIIKLFNLDGNEQRKLYDCASNSYKEKKVPADIAEFIINNEDAKDKIRKLMKDYK